VFSLKRLFFATVKLAEAPQCPELVFVVLVPCASVVLPVTDVE